MLAAMQSDLLRTLDVFLGWAKKPLIVLLGPTASGKTALSLEVAKYIGGEIVNGDSRQLYKYLDIGTAKILLEEMEGIPHHLLSVKDPKEEVTVGWYQREAQRAIEEIHARKKIPLLVGGSMLYVSSIIDGLTLAPAADSALRASLEKEYAADGGMKLYQRLQEVDPEAAETIHMRNKPYVIRAVEIYEITKKPKSKSFVGVYPELRRRAQPDTHDTLLLGLQMPRGDLKERIAKRVEEMFAAGWIEEVRELLSRGYTASDPGLKSHGYREIVQYLEELEKSGSDVDLDAMQESLKAKIVTKTSQYAKRQMTWWRNDERIHWVST